MSTVHAPPTHYQRSQPTSGLAVASLILSLLWLFWIGSFIAVILGAVAIRDCKNSGRPGLVLACVGFGLGVLSFLVIPGLAVIGAISG